MGESGLFEELARRNIDAFNEMGVQKIVTLSPHAFNALKNDYPPLGGRYQVHHYTQVMAFAMGRIEFAPSSAKVRVAFHDPCYLGRHSGDYESPRMMLRAVPGVELVEMDRHRQNALCCGGGGGNFFTDILSGGGDTPSRARVREALSAGAHILAVACPQCAIMLGEAVKSEGLEEKLQVREVSEVARWRMRDGG
jgi:Fe-S oxidoreductase